MSSDQAVARMIGPRRTGKTSLEHTHPKLFKTHRIHVRTLAPICRLLCGKIGELTDVLSQLWLSAKPDDVLDEAAQIAAIHAAALDKSLPEIDDLLRALTLPQAIPIPRPQYTESIFNHQHAKGLISPTPCALSV